MPELLKDLETPTTWTQEFSVFKIKHKDPIFFVGFCCEDKAGNCSALKRF